MLIGVASDIDALVGHHESIQRCTEQIQMPPMTDREIQDLVLNGFALLADLSITLDALSAVVAFSRGYPAFAHSMAKAASEIVIREQRSEVQAPDVSAGALAAIASIPYTLGETYKLATDVRHPSDSTPSTLAAAAWCPMQRFRPSDVLNVLAGWGVRASLRNVANHLKRLATADRGNVLVAYGTTHPAYEFRDPMFVPYVVIQMIGTLPPRDDADAASDGDHVRGAGRRT